MKRTRRRIGRGEKEAIRAALAEGKTVPEIAKTFGRSSSSIFRIKAHMPRKKGGIAPRSMSNTANVVQALSLTMAQAGISRLTIDLDAHTYEVIRTTKEAGKVK